MIHLAARPLPFGAISPAAFMAQDHSRHVAADAGAAIRPGIPEVEQGGAIGAARLKRPGTTSTGHAHEATDFQRMERPDRYAHDLPLLRSGNHWGTVVRAILCGTLGRC